MSNSTYIIAEAGVNHNGSLELAKKLVDVAKISGVDAVKFQTYKTENLVTQSAHQASYQVKNLGEETTQFEMLKKLELSYQQFKELKEYCNHKDIEFLSTPFDFESVDFLVHDLQLKTIKIPSGELTNSPFVHYLATKQVPIILSTGMATIEEIHESLSFIAFGLEFPGEDVDLEKVETFYNTHRAKEVLEAYVKVLHCTTEYPAPYKTINLHAMKGLSDELKLPIGYSDHSEGITVPIAAVALGARVIEKHFTIDKSLPGPDHMASLNPMELGSMVNGIRAVEQSLGSVIKEPTQIEIKNREAARKSIVAKERIVKGQPIARESLTFKRPGNGMDPSRFWSLIGKSATRNYEEDDLLNE
ncbi:N-acetylneuraminate synthase [Sporosarcina sp. SAFN-010]|uniref:N-acetylneuraminate synthase n=1 Tax=Sporosarcina sp. SAFN-010 TaxID=3387273 RepID=UPI003F7D4914